MQKTNTKLESHAQQVTSKSVVVKPVEIALYTDKDLKSKVIETFTLPNNDYVAFFVSGHWLKVYNKHDGATYWIDQAQLDHAQDVFHQAQQARWQKEMQAYKPQSSYIYIEKHQGADKQPSTKIVAYENGKALSQKEAQALYKKMQKNQSTLDSQFNAMHKQFGDQEQLMDQVFRSFSHPIYVPVYIEHQKRQLSPQEVKDKS